MVCFLIEVSPFHIEPNQPTNFYQLVNIPVLTGRGNLGP
jgi:hypothetical protein